MLLCGCSIIYRKQRARVALSNTCCHPKFCAKPLMITIHRIKVVDINALRAKCPIRLLLKHKNRSGTVFNWINSHSILFYDSTLTISDWHSDSYFFKYEHASAYCDDTTGLYNSRLISGTTIETA